MAQGKKTKKLTQRAKLAAKPKKFASGKKIDPELGAKFVKEARKSEDFVPKAIVLDRVAKTFAKLEEQRERIGTPMLDGFLEHADDRGLIQNLIHEPVGSVAVITSNENTVRANHYHKEDAHLCWVLQGRIEYYERPVGSKENAEKWVVSAGQGFYTGPQAEHAMYFPEETVFITLGRLSRMPDDYERDLVRLEGASKLVVPLSREDFLKKMGIADVNTTPVGGTPVVEDATAPAVTPSA